MSKAAWKHENPTSDLAGDTLGDWLVPDESSPAVQLTLVPTEHDQPVAFVPTPRRGRLSPVPPLPVAPVAKTPAPAPARTGLLVAGAMGGGVVVGGGLVAGLALLLAAGAAALGGLALAGAGAAWLATRGAAPLEAPVVEAPVAEAPVAEEPAAEEPAAEAPADAPKAPARAKTPGESPAAPTPAAPARPAAPAPSEVPGELVSVKILTDPPAAVLTVDGEARGRTPMKLDLEPGPHTIGLTAGKATGTFTVDAGMDGDRFCYTVAGKKIASSTCN